MKRNTINKFYLITVSLLLSISLGCGEKVFVPPDDIQASEDLEEVRDYIVDTLSLPSDSPLWLTNKLAKGVVGLCHHKSSTVFISRSWWEGASDIGRAALLLHEILHCDYNIKHTKKKRQLMSEEITDSIQCIIDNGEKECLTIAFRIHAGEKE